MSYQQDSFDQLGTQDRKPTKWEWAVIGIALLMGALMFANAIWGDRAPRWLHDLRGLPVAAAMFLIGTTFLIRARANGPEEQYSPRALRWMAALFFLIGAAQVAVAFI